MGAVGNLVPLVILFAVVAGLGWVGYQIYLYSTQLAARANRKMEKKHMVFSKDGARVSVKEVRAEDYADRTQRAFVKTWNAAHEGSGSSPTSRSSSYSEKDKRPAASRTRTK